MARDATARLYDVDDASLVYKKPEKKGKYDHGTITFHAKKGKLINLDKLHESIWATRLSGGTRSGLVTLDIKVVGNVVVGERETLLNVAGSDDQFVLAETSNTKTKVDDPIKMNQLRSALARGDKVVSVTGRLDGWTGHWPAFLAKPPPTPRRLLVTDFEVSEK